ncbi:MAG TPA: chromosome segregation protein SMC [Alphaproteobacteria bacterium]
MHFNTLRLSGFKSFVEPTELLIQPGLTGVVGPNGCGKSNLVEALRWVMGESSAKQMRGGEMDDVIFGGTSDRPARNLAEVVLTLDNAERTAPAMFNDSDEIEVTRHIERGAGSTFRVNGREVRARDVQLLFADAASGSKSTALVSQGRIGAIVSAKPADRRHLLEEAAGITGLHSRRHEAELRLSAAETNLTRLDDVIKALDEQLRGLKRQARQATRYRNLSEHIRRAEAILLHWRWKDATAARADAAARLAEAERLAEELTRGTAAISARQADLAAGLPELRRAEAEAAAALQRLRLARDALDAEEKRLAEAISAIEARLAQVAQDKAREQGFAQDATDAIRRLEDEQARLRAAQAGEEGEVAGAAEALHRARAESDRIEDELATLAAKAAQYEAREAGLERRIADLDGRRARVEERLAQLAAAVAEAASEAGDERALEDARAMTASRREALESARKAQEAAEQARGATEATLATARETWRKADAEAARLAGEEKALGQLLGAGNPDLWPPLVDAVTVAAGCEMALGAALGDDLAAPADEAAPVHWRTLGGDAAAPALPPGARPLSEFVTAPAALARRLAQIGVVADERAGEALKDRLAQGQRLVSRDGALWRWDGFTAKAGAPTPAATRLAQRNRLAEARAERAACEGIAAEARARLDAAEADGRRAAEADSRTRTAARTAESEFQDALDSETALAERAAATASRRAALTEEGKRLEAERAEALAEIETARGDLARFRESGAVRAQAEAKRAELAAARERLTERQSAHDRLEREAAHRTQRLAEVAEQHASWQRRAEAACAQIAQLDERRRAAESEADGLRARPAEIAAQRTELFERIDAAEKAQKNAADALVAAETRVEATGRELKAAEARLGEARENRVRCESAVGQAEQALKMLAERITEKLGCRPDAALAAVDVEDDDKLPDPTATEARLARLIHERDTMGPVNLRAETEAQELEERITTLTTERDDLLAAIARLRQGIAGLNREGRERLLAAFTEVDKHFQDLFVRLFGGGRAHLSLTDAEDPLEAGLEIMASPPGKKPQVLSLLSGGEQALTALALLFAVFLTNPAPVCVLDEVDAPLDDANVDRFCALLDEIAQASATRFLIVTHHRLTMTRMDRLFGVTMAERGVSQLVSVDLAAAEGLRATA